ncbi:MAG: hypothetical protein Ct9H300mP32_4160 [Verrucomicrobiota bacterium]|nr:MAG: hypothetical protein Ct9H300mP32_4160 [Verrucomicrobiota bacterium]
MGLGHSQVVGAAEHRLGRLMVACLLAALMSTVDCFMIVCAALVVRNIYQPYVKPDASEADSLMIARIIGALVVAGSVGYPYDLDMFANLQLTWIVPMLFAAVFWVGMYWRRRHRRGVDHVHVLSAVLPRAADCGAQAHPGLTNSPAYTRRATSSRAPSPAPPSAGCLTRQGECRWQVSDGNQASRGVALFWTGESSQMAKRRSRRLVAEKCRAARRWFTSTTANSWERPVAAGHAHH